MTAVSPAPVWDVINGFSSYWALSAALDLGLFDALAKSGAQGLDGVQLAAAIGARRPEAATLLAEALVALSLLEAGGTRFTLTPAAARYVLSSSDASMGALVRYSPGPQHAWPALAETIRTGSPDDTVAADLLNCYPDLARATAPTQAAVAAAAAAELDRRGLRPERLTVVDLGCGSGAWLTALLADRPDGVGVAVDLPNVLPMAERAATVAVLRERVTAVAGDYLSLALPVQRADVVVLAHVLRAEPAARAHRLLARAIELARPSGVVVVADYPRPDADHAGSTDRSAECIASRHELLLSLTMLASTAGTGISVADLRAWSAAADAELDDCFEAIPRQHVHLIRPQIPEATS